MNVCLGKRSECICMLTLKIAQKLSIFSPPSSPRLRLGRVSCLDWRNSWLRLYFAIFSVNETRQMARAAWCYFNWIIHISLYWKLIIKICITFNIITQVQPGSIYTMFQKNVCHYIFDDSLNKNCPIALIFDTLITQTIVHRRVVSFSPPHIVCATILTWKTQNTKIHIIRSMQHVILREKKIR